MIPRYTRPELGRLWTDEARMDTWRQVEVAACEELPGLLGADGPDGGRARGDPRARASRSRRSHERERVTDHDVAAFVDVLAASAGEAGRWIHFGLTSSDVLDTALALQLRAAGEVILTGARSLTATLAARAREHAGHAVRRAHARRSRRADDASGSSSPASRSRPTATPSACSAPSRRSPLGRSPARSAPTPPPALSSRRACSQRLGLAREDVSTQVVPRDRHAELLSAIALAGAGLERFATEVRHLQRTEVREVQEPFRAGQKGSSAMPHKRNPIKSEQISGLARVLRGNAQAALENVALWHERDISHSSVERVILPDSTILLDYLQHRTIALVRDMTVDAERMRANLELTHGALFSQRVLLALVEAGSSRDEAYRIVQELAQRAWDEGIPLRELLAADERAARPGPRRDLRLRPLPAPRRGDHRAPGPDRLSAQIASVHARGASMRRPPAATDSASTTTTIENTRKVSARPREGAAKPAAIAGSEIAR